MTETSTGRSTRVLVALAAVSVILFAAQAAKALIVPFILAVFLSIIGNGSVEWLKRKGLPDMLAVSLVVLGMLAVVALLGAFVGQSIATFSERLPFYQERLEMELQQLGEQFGRDVSIDALLKQIEPGAAVRFFGRMLNSLGGVFGNMFLVVFTVFFMLLEAASFPNKVRRAFQHADRTNEGFRRFADSIQRYLKLKTLICLATGACVSILAWAVALDFPLLWGFVAFALNYIPSIGSIIAAVPAIMLAFLQYGVGSAIAVAIGYLVINIVFGSIMEPRVMGRGVGLSPLVVFTSLVFWGWVLGPVGMLLAVPLTMTFKIACEGSPKTEWLAILLGPADEPKGPPPLEAKPA